MKSLGIRDVENVESAKYLLSIVPECDRRTLVFQMPPLGFWDYDNLLHKACATGNTELARYWLESGFFFDQHAKRILLEIGNHNSHIPNVA